MLNSKDLLKNTYTRFRNILETKQADIKFKGVINSFFVIADVQKEQDT